MIEDMKNSENSMNTTESANTNIIRTAIPVNMIPALEGWGGGSVLQKALSQFRLGLHCTG